MSEYLQVQVSVLGILMKGNKILLQRRSGTGWQDGKYTIPSGRVDAGELPKTALVRELKEEIDIVVEQDDLEFVYVDYVLDQSVNIIFKVKKWEGEPIIMEPEKCDELLWVELDNLPDNLLGRGGRILDDIATSISYSEYKDY